MSSGQRLIKYLAIAFAVFLAIIIISGIASAVFAIVNVVPGNGRFHSDKWRNETSNVSKNFEDVKSLDISNATGEFKIVIGEDFKIEAEHVNSNFNAQVESDGTLIISDHKRGDGFPFSFFDGIDSPDSKVILYLPSDFIAEKADIESGAGNVEIEGLKANELQISAGAGNLNGRDITAEKVDIEGGLGNVTLEDINFSDTVLESGMGNLHVSGTLLDRTDISCGVGEVELNISGSPSDYGFTVDTGIGKVNLNGEKISGDYEHNTDAPNVIDIDGGIGNVDIYMKE